MANWAQFGHFHLGVYSLMWPAVQSIESNIHFVNLSVYFTKTYRKLDSQLFSVDFVVSMLLSYWRA